MIPKLQYRATNWINGMKITEGHLTNQENFHTDQLRDSLALHLTDYNYGLLPATTHQTALDIEVNSEWVEVNQCRAITAGGGRIEVVAAEAKELKMPTRQLLGSHSIPESSTWYVVLKVNPFERQPAGTVEANETPLRHPYTRPKYALDVIAVERVNPSEFSAYQLPVAKIQGSKGGLRVVEEYIPPCMRVNSHPDLVKYYQDFGSRLQSIQNYTDEIIKNLYQQQEEQERLEPLAKDIKLLVENIALFVANNLDYYRMFIQQQAPLHMVELFARFSRIIGQSLRLMSNKESFFEYCKIYLGITPSDWDFAIMNQAYNHLEIKDSINLINNFLDMQEQWFLKKLSQIRRYTLMVEKKEVYDPVKDVKINKDPVTPVRPNDNGNNSGGKFSFKNLIG